MSTQTVVPDKLRTLLALAKPTGLPTTSPDVTATIPDVPVPPAAPLAMQRLPVPSAPPNPAVAATQARTLGDIGKLNNLTTSGSGIDQITHPIDSETGLPTTQKPSLLRRFGGVLAKIGDVGADLALGRGAAIIPGTELHHQMLLNQQQGLVNNDLGDQQKQAQTAETQALADYTQQRPDIEQSRLDQKQTAVQQRVAQAAAARGQTVTWDENGLPTFHDDVTSQAYLDHQALSAMHQASADRAKLLDEIQRNHYIPGTPEFTEAQKKLAQVDQRLAIARGALGIKEQAVGLRKQEDDANFLGTYDGQPIGTYNGAGQPEGLRVAGANAPTTMRLRQSDLAHNVQENARDINAIIKSRPDLFGAVQGRFTTVQQMIGSDDPAIAQLGVMFHNIALASNGAHGLRSQEAVMATENELLNHFRNGPAATSAALKAMTDSVQTFIDAANRGKQVLPDAGAAPKEGDTKTNSAGDKIVYRGGKWQIQ